MITTLDSCVHDNQELNNIQLGIFFYIPVFCSSLDVSHWKVLIFHLYISL